MKNAEMPAFPPNAGWEHSEAKGFTKREVVIKDFMAAMLSNYHGGCKFQEPNQFVQPDPAAIFAIASECADKMFEEMEKENK